MPPVTLVSAFLLCVLCVFTHPAIGMSRQLNPDWVYFPDQAEYLKKAMKCPDNTVYWPGTSECYKEGEQGPCNFGRVIVLDEKLFQPFCKDDPL